MTLFPDMNVLDLSARFVYISTQTLRLIAG